MTRDRTAEAVVAELPASVERQQAADESGLTLEGKLWLAACAVLLVTGLLKGINLLILLSYLLMGIWVVNWRLVRRNLRRIKGQRLPTGPVVAGISASFQIEIANAYGRPMAGMLVRDRGPEHDRSWMVLRLEPERPARIRWQRVFTKRGRYLTGPLTAISREPFGLLGRTVELAPPAEWIVLPRLGAVNGEWLRQWLLRTTRGDGRVRRRVWRPAVDGTDIHGLRDYRVGDSPRLIHWRTSARRGQMLVREFEVNPALDLVLVVEPWLPAESNEQDRARLEALISLAATICKEWCRDATSRLTLIVAQRQTVVLPASSGPDFAVRTMQALAVADGIDECAAVARSGSEGFANRAGPRAQQPVRVAVGRGNFRPSGSPSRRSLCR
jgi:uncharacterized protein (DUF58 family)